ncbi:hypothetical protein [Methanococcoides alaskense]|uniref:Ammonia channel protein AmtB n=1 Tax=Methanococcoides alaskense TaxID=325778 RepID=A0AA90TX74_9EURY|nr:hypothetical protein [Methanococcoides alaskense]MDA0525472.1 hypothetical protein [Methanococcoides alaskense]MDR6221593.1 ammonia channel protein AmtB [Methanococcoides alaskense]
MVILSDAVYVAEVVGLIYGGVNQFIIQAVGMILSIISAFGISFIVFEIIDLTIGIRVPEEDRSKVWSC